MRFYAICILSFFFSISAFSQQELGTVFLKKNGLSNLQNPARVTENKLTAAATGYYNLSSSGFTYNDLIKVESNGKVFYDFETAITGLDDKNNFQANLDIIPLNLVYNKGKYFVDFHYGLKNSGFTRYGKTLPDLVWNGNSKYIGETLDKVGPSFQGMRYHEFAVGGGMVFNKISVGAKVKYLNGVFDVSSAENNFFLYTETDAYQITAQTDFLVNTSNLPEIRIDSLTGGFVEPANLNYKFSSNSGLGFDFGVDFQATEKLTLAFSVLDLGFINWKSDTYNYRHQHEFEFRGLDLNAIVTADSLDFSSIVDSIGLEYDFAVSNDGYKTKLPAKLLLAAQYELPKEITIGGLFYSEFNNGTYLPAVTLDVSKQLGKYFRLGLNYSYRNRSWLNLGLHLEAEYGPLRFFAVSDNILGTVNPWNSKNGNGRIGLSVNVARLYWAGTPVDEPTD